MNIKINNQFLEVKICNTFRSRFIGMMFQKQASKVGYFFPKCNSIHTFFMKQPIDIIMTNQNHEIIFIYRNVKPFKIIFPKKGVTNTYEFSIHVLKNINIYDKINII